MGHFGHVVPSARFTMAVTYAIIALGAVAMLLVFFQKWLAAATVGGIFVIGLFGVPALMRRTEPGELRRETERFVDAWARGMASASGAGGHIRAGGAQREMTPRITPSSW